MRYWMSKVSDKSKLILGVSTYGRTFTLRKTRHNDYNVPTTGPGDAGEFTQQPGMLAYYEASDISFHLRSLFCIHYILNIE